MAAANARILGEVEYRAGDGPMLRIRPGPCQIELAEDSAVIEWEEEGNALNAAIPLTDYHGHVEAGRIAPAA